MAVQMSSHFKRIATALLLLPVLALLVYAGGGAMKAGIAVIAGLGLWEYYSFFAETRDNTLLKILGIASSCLLVAAVPLSGAALSVAIWGILVCASVFFMRGMTRNPDETSFMQLLIFMGGLIYITLPLSLMGQMPSMEVVLILVGVFATDTGAFYSGRAWGNAKIWPQISPKKTWAGSFGGLALCCLICLLVGLLWGTAPLWSFLIFGIIINLAAQMGDFFESALKRRTGVKDSSAILPGHGGILDRMDSMIFAVPAFWGWRILSETSFFPYPLF